LALLAVSVAALIALAAPVAAQAEGSLWYVNGEEVGNVKEAVEVDFNGNMSWTMGVMGGWKFGPCEISGKGSIYNTNGGAEEEGYVGYLQAAPECPVYDSYGKKVCSMKNSGFNGFIYPFALGEESSVTAAGVSFYTALTSGCAQAGLGATALSWSGPLTGHWKAGSNCIEYVNAGSLIMWGGKYAMNTNGSLCLSAEGNPTIEVK
jgi:hypothetical protein